MRVRVHQHVNPLATFYRQKPDPIDFGKIFVSPEKPLLLDIGCGRGRFLKKMAQMEPERNYLGIEIREPLVREANELAAAAGLSNLHYVFGNALLWMDELIKHVPQEVLVAVTIQFPDPWFKKKHAKRRMVSTSMANSIIERLSPGGIIFIQTDIQPLFQEMALEFDPSGVLTILGPSENPFPVKTEREISVETRDLPVYRKLWRKRT